MKILQIHNYYRYRGGEDRYVSILEDSLAQQGHEVVHFLTDSRYIQRYSFLEKLRIPFRLIKSRTLNRELEKLLDKEKPDIAVVHNLFPLMSLSLLKVLKQKNIPVLKRLENYKFLCLNGLFLRNNFKTCELCKQGNFMHGVVHRCYQRSFFNSLGIALGEFLHHRWKTVIKCSDLFLATSGFVKSKFVEAGFPADAIKVHPNFLDFEPIPSTVPPEEYVIYVGRLSREKGLTALLKAFKGLPHLKLVMLGEGPQELELKRFVKENNMQNVVFQGFVDGDAKREIIKKALFLIFPSECYESFGYTIIEGYGCGVPVIASDLGGARELVTEGETGYLFQPGNPEDLQNQINHILEDRKRLLQMKENALALAKEKYTRDTGCKHLAALFDSLKSNGRK